MKATELYKILEDAGLDFELVEIFEGARILSFEVDADEDEDELTEQARDMANEIFGYKGDKA